MTSVDEQLTTQFYSWELRGRGWQLFDQPVLPEPAFRPFDGHYLTSQPDAADDGRRQTPLSSFVESLRHVDQISGDSGDFDDEQEPPPTIFERGEITAVAVTFPRDFEASRDDFERFLFNIAPCDDPVAFEVLAADGKIAVQFVASPADARVIRKSLRAYFPSAVATLQDDLLAPLWQRNHSRKLLIIDFGLKEEFVTPVLSRRSDFLVALSASFSELQTEDVGLFQVLFQPVRSAWAKSVLRAVTDEEGKPFFSNRPELLTSAKAKISRPLYAAVVRVAALTSTSNQSHAVVREIATALELLSEPNGNAFVPLNSSDYPSVDQAADLVRRQSRRSGMLLNSNELLALVHLPTPAVQTPKLLRQINKTHTAPASVKSDSGVLIGSNLHAGNSVDVRLTAEQRVRHVHIIGAPGSGKSTLLFNMIRQDIQNGSGLALLDPHGDLAESLLDVIPTSRINDVIYVDPADANYSIGFNVLAATSDLEKTLLASDLVSVFQRLSTSWGDQMNSVLQNAILAFLESETGGTLSDLRRFLLDTAYRADFLKTVRDSEVVYYWQKGFPQLAGNKSIGPILTRLETFLSPKPIRAMVSQPLNRLDFGDMMDTGKIFIAKLSQGQIGRENAYLLGSLFVSKFQQAAMARQSLAEEQRRDFWIYIDEFHHFITPSMGEILTGARKYHVGLTLAHQELSQLHRANEIAGPVLSTHSRIVFRVNDADSRALAEGFSNFEPKDLRNLEIGNAICRVERSDFDFNLKITSPSESLATIGTAARDEVIAKSRAQYAALRADIEKSLHLPIAEPAQLQKQPPEIPTAPAVSATSEPIEAEEVTDVAPEPPVAAIKAAAKAEIPKPLGKGGQKHTYLQRLIKQWAQGMGYLAVIEEPLPTGGQIDVALKKRERLVACEISVTTPTAYEIGNIKKCLDAGYDFVAMIGTDEKRVDGLEKAIAPKLTTDELAKVRFLTVDGLFQLIEQLDAKDATREETVRGYRVKVSHQVVDQTTKADRIKMLAKVVAESLKRPTRE